ncbi:MAG: serine hydrolase [Bacteroidota bacterium]
MINFLLNIKSLLSVLPMKSVYLFFFICLINPLNISAQPTSLHDLLEKNRDAFSEILDHPEKYEVQIIYTQINRDEHNYPSFKTYRYQVNPKKYFYPASTVKMPAAFLALEKLNQLNILGLDKSSKMMTDQGQPPQSIAHVDSTAANLSPSIEHYIKKIFLVSDNDAFNRLFEFLNVDYFNKSLWKKGYHDLHIIHRLGGEGARFDLEGNRYTNPIRFFNGDELVYFQGESYGQIQPRPGLKNVFKGKGHYNRAGEKKMYPFDFSHKNYCSLENLHEMLKTVIFPEAIAPYQRFDLTAKDYQFLYRSMSARPRTSQYPAYDKPDAYVKFFLYGGTTETIPESIHIFNKVGYAYGFLSDIAYIIDVEHQVEFLLSAVIHVNDNQIYNDNNYQYDEIGLPFLAKLGEVIYEHEKRRPKKHLPNLDEYLSEKQDNK